MGIFGGDEIPKPRPTTMGLLDKYLRLYLWLVLDLDDVSSLVINATWETTGIEGEGVTQHTRTKTEGQTIDFKSHKDKSTPLFFAGQEVDEKNDGLYKILGFEDGIER